MAKWLSQEWMDKMVELAQSQPERPGVNAKLQYVITGVEGGDVSYYWVIENGKMVTAQLGTLDEAEVTLTQSVTDAMKVQKGEMDANTAFMQGKVKVTGNMGKLMSLLPLTNAPEYKQLEKEVLASTEF